MRTPRPKLISIDHAKELLCCDKAYRYFNNDLKQGKLPVTPVQLPGEEKDARFIEIYTVKSYVCDREQRLADLPLSDWATCCKGHEKRVYKALYEGEIEVHRYRSRWDPVPDRKVQLWAIAEYRCESLGVKCSHNRR